MQITNCGQKIAGWFWDCVNLHATKTCPNKTTWTTNKNPERFQCQNLGPSPTNSAFICRYLFKEINSVPAQTVNSPIATALSVIYLQSLFLLISLCLWSWFINPGHTHKSFAQAETYPFQGDSSSHHFIATGYHGCVFEAVANPNADLSKPKFKLTGLQSGTKVVQTGKQPQRGNNI